MFVSLWQSSKREENVVQCAKMQLYFSAAPNLFHICTLVSKPEATSNVRHQTAPPHTPMLK